MKKLIAAGAAFGLPMIAFAQIVQGTVSGTQTFAILGLIKSALNLIIPILITLAIIYFIWSLISYIGAAGEEEQKKARSGMILSIIVIFVAVSIWGLVYFIGQTLGIDQGGTASLPCVDQNPVTPECD